MPKKVTVMKRTRMLAKGMLLAGVFAGSICVLPARAQSSAPARQPSAAGAPVHFVTELPRQAQMYYAGVWGIDSLKVKYTESGEMIRFSWRVLEPAKAALLNDKKAEPSLIDPQAGVQLVVPQMEKVGKLRQSSTPVAGQSYWMAFSNKGRLVKRGDRVMVVIGQFRADWLLVE